MDTDCPWFGSLHSAKVFMISKLNIKIKSNQVPTFYHPLAPGYPEVLTVGSSMSSYTSLHEYSQFTNNDQTIFNKLLRGVQN